MISTNQRRVAAGVAVGLLGTFALAPQAAAAAVDGVWQTDGYGTVIEIANGEAKLYETTRISCLAGESVPQSADPTRFGEFTFRAYGNTATQHIDGTVSDRRLRRIGTLPTECATPGPMAPLRTFDVFWTTYAENYPFFALKGIDWNAVRDRYRPRVRADMTDDQLYGLLVEMITPLGDAHTGILAGKRFYFGERPGTTFPTPALEEKIRPYIVRRDLGGKPLEEFGKGRIGYADLPDGIGYLRVTGFTGYTDGDYADDQAELTRALDTIFSPARTKAWRGLIIDLRINGGGEDQFGLDLAGRLTHHPYFAYAKQNRNDPTDPTRFTTPQRSQVRPAANPYTGPVVLLTGGSTISAGETFTQATLGRTPPPVRIGAHTQGVFSDVMERTLPNGWKFILPNERFLTRWGHTFDGTGIPPHISTPVFTEEEFAYNRDSAFDRAVTLLR